MEENLIVSLCEYKSFSGIVGGGGGGIRIRKKKKWQFKIKLKFKFIEF
jgi:hypothetical protein